MFKTWLDEPISTGKCVLGWIFSFGVFVGLIAVLGGPTDSDSTTSIYSTWAIAHGAFSCAYVHANILAPPLYPLLSGAVVAALRIGSHTSFPTASQLGPHCSTAVSAIAKWSTQADAWPRTLQVGDLTWLALMGGLVAMLRTTNRGHRGWEPFALVLVALSLPVLMPLLEDFHPQDVLALGLSIGALACIRRDAWTWAGVLMGLAYTSQQFAVLTAVVILAIAPSGRRWRFTVAAFCMVAMVGVPLIALTSGRATRALLVGTGLSPSFGSTFMVESGLHGSYLTGLARVVPILASLAIAVWAVRRLGTSVLAADTLVSLLGISLCLRLVFELNLWGYYFMPLSVALVLLDVINGRIRGYTIAWLAMVTLVFNPILFYQFATGRTYGLGPFRAIQIVFLAAAFILILYDILRHRIRWYLVAWFALALVAFVTDGWMYGPPHKAFPLWFWQIVLLSTAAVLIAGPITSKLHNREKSTSPV
jgi:hypothetical protein